jgi:hypothetical protein
LRSEPLEQQKTTRAEQLQFSDRRQDLRSLSDADIMGCVAHGLGKLSAVETAAAGGRVVRERNPVASSARVAAHMSRADFAGARERLHWFEDDDDGMLLRCNELRQR